VPLRAAIGWEQTADDVNDAAEFLIDNGFSTRGQICAVGKDYGAYSSFMTAIKYPDALQCIVSIAGITDPRLTPGARVIGSTVSGVTEDFLDVSSPIKRAQEINSPVLMFHGENDPDVSMANHTVTFFNAMSSAGKDIEFNEYTYDNHEIRRGLYRIDMLARTGEFLVEHIGPPPAPPAATAPPDNGE
jgi:dipeptidyl aminopeptidase/acylaminoacyl peptidase